MATIGFFYNSVCDDKTKHFFIVENGINSWSFLVTGFNNGTAEVKVSDSSDIEDVFDAVIGCFETDSNFREELFKAYNCDESTALNEIRIIHENATLSVSENVTPANKYKLLAEYWKELYLSKVRYENYCALRPSVNQECW